MNIRQRVTAFIGPVQLHTSQPTALFMDERPGARVARFASLTIFAKGVDVTPLRQSRARCFQPFPEDSTSIDYGNIRASTSTRLGRLSECWAPGLWEEVKDLLIRPPACLAATLIQPGHRGWNRKCCCS